MRLHGLFIEYFFIFGIYKSVIKTIFYFYTVFEQIFIFLGKTAKAADREQMAIHHLATVFARHHAN
jgi:hypothetical protein